MSRFPDSILVREALSRFFHEHGLGPDGGYNSRWVRIRIAGPLSIYFPNVDSRRRSVLLHDLQHIGAQYGTTLIAEAEIAAWEIGGGCADHAAAWILDTGALLYGLPFAPRRIFRAFIRGRHSRTLYHEPFDPALLDQTVGALRRQLHLDDRPTPATRRDLMAFAAWSTAVVAADLAVVAVPVLGAIGLLRLASG